MADSQIQSAIQTNATGPASASVDGNSARQHSLKDQIEADRYIASKNAVQSAKRGLAIAKLKPPASI